MSKNQVQNSVNKVKRIRIVQLIFGYIITCFCGIFLLVTLPMLFSDKGASMVPPFIFYSVVAAAGIWLIVCGNKKKRLIQTFIDYSHRFAVEPTHSISLIASSTGITIEKAIKNINTMIKKGLFPNAYIDNNTQCLIFANMPQAPQQAQNSAPVNQAPTSKEVLHKTVQCQGCGATNQVIVGAVSECEFCGSKISAE